MRRIVALLSAGMFLVVLGCAAGQPKGDAGVTKDTKVRCPKCGVEFKVGEGMGGK